MLTEIPQPLKKDNGMYLLFAWSSYESMGGFNDYIGSFCDIADAILYAENLTDLDQWHVVDVDTNNIVINSDD